MRRCNHGRRTFRGCPAEHLRTATNCGLKRLTRTQVRVARCSAGGAVNNVGVDEEAVERVREVVAAIPPGRVLAYGDVAARAGLRSPRLVGRIMA